MVQEKIHIYFIRIGKLWNSMPEIDLSLTFNQTEIIPILLVRISVKLSTQEMYVHSTLFALALNVNT